jgi:hypothetical protein
MNLEQFAQMRALESAYTSTNRAFVDHLIATDKAAADQMTKRIQFDCAPFLADELEKVCGLLQCSKREFMEGAVVEALDRAQKAYFATLEKVAQDEAGPQYSLTAVEG